MGEYVEARDYFLEKFRHEVEIFQHLHEEHDMKSLIIRQKQKEREGKVKNKRMSWYIPDAVVEKDSRLMRAFEDFPPADQLFVRLLDYSKEKRLLSDPEDSMDEMDSPSDRKNPEVKNNKKKKKLNKKQRKKVKKQQQQKAAA